MQLKVLFVSFCTILGAAGGIYGTYSWFKSHPIITEQIKENKIIETRVETLIKAEQPYICFLYFSMQNCLPCQKQKPILHQLKTNKSIHLISYSEADQQVIEDWKITRFPTLILLVDGHEVSRRIGFQSEEQILQWQDAVRNWLNKNLPNIKELSK